MRSLMVSTKVPLLSVGASSAALNIISVGIQTSQPRVNIFGE